MIMTEQQWLGLRAIGCDGPPQNDNPASVAGLGIAMMDGGQVPATLEEQFGWSRGG